MFTRPVHIGLSPNTAIDDIRLAFTILFQPWKWLKGKTILSCEQWFKDYFNTDYANSFNSGRSALLTILKSLNLPANSEIMIQAFTCVAVINSIKWAKLQPVFIDIDRSLNISIIDAEKKLTSLSKVIIIQHTFGVPADIEKITAFCQKHNLILIEDCAHSLGTFYKGKLVGTFGEAAFFSFGRDKIVSSVWGGMVITNNKSLGNKITQYQEILSYPSYFWVFQQLLHPLITYLCLLFYNCFSIGKVLLWLSQKLKLLSFPVYDIEKKGQQPNEFPKKYPNGLAILLFNQLQKFIRINQTRKDIAKQYFAKINPYKYILPIKLNQIVFLRFNLLTQRADELRFKAKKNDIILGDWYKNIIAPVDVDLTQAGYVMGSCPKAEKAALNSLNLPTSPNLTQKQINQIVIFLNTA